MNKFRRQQILKRAKYAVRPLLGIALLVMAQNVQGADPWADEIVEAHSAMLGNGLYDDPESALGPPATHYYDPLWRLRREVSLIAPASQLDDLHGRKLLATIPSGQFIKLRFAEPIEDHPRNPFGIDLIVFGNSFFVGNGFAGPTTDLDSFVLSGGLFAEPVTVAVSRTGLGDPATHPDEWHVYAAGPFADGLLPTNAFLWDRTARQRGESTDATIPPDPELVPSDFAGRSAAEAIEAYSCSAGGTGFDLAESGFDRVQYVYLTSAGGEVDALADVFASLGDWDRDGDLDLADFASLQNCFGLHVGPAGTCHCQSGDLDGSRRIDELDFQEWESHVRRGE
jgi:hypothetical protein